MRKKLSIVLCLLLIAQDSFAVLSTEATQIMNNIELIKSVDEEVKQNAKMAQSLVNEAMQLQRQFELLTVAYNNIQKVGAMSWGKGKNNMNQLAWIIKQGKAIAFSMENVDEIMRERFPTYSDFLFGKELDEDVFEEQYQSWSETTHDTVISAMKGTSLQQEQFEEEEINLEKLNELNDDPKGQLQALQVGNNMSAEMVRQMQKLRQLMMLQNQVIAVETSKEQSEKDAQKAYNKKFYEKKIQPSTAVVQPWNLK